ncbi:MAG: SH3 domain-containing protein [Candidatus Omnitrophota bacterium]|nr:SH3 domain-containing protein [Candidatus Omnitrophota bacterium]MDZ4242323.1 SH3 domain-containing protein [Candidatus Omnitrophota bacterium]
MIIQRPLLFAFAIVLATGPAAFSEEQFPFVAEVKAQNVNIRSGQSTSFEKVGRFQQGDKAVVAGEQYGWYKVQLPIDAESYVSNKFVTLIQDDIGEITGNRVNVRAGAGDRFSVITQLNKGTLVRILNKLDAWYRIEPVEQSYGWVSQEFLAFHSKDLPPPRTVEPPVRNIYARKRMEDAKSAEPAAAGPAAAPAAGKKRIAVSGLVEDAGERSIAADVRHTITAGDSSVYYIKGDPEMIGRFLRHTVRMEGTLQADIAAPYPVLTISKIHLVL